MRWIKFFRRQFCRCNCALLVPFPENRAQASASRPAKIRDEIIDLRVRNFCPYTVHSRLAIQCFAQRRSAQLTVFPSREDSESAWIKTIEGASKFIECCKFQV